MLLDSLKIYIVWVPAVLNLAAIKVVGNKVLLYSPKQPDEILRRYALWKAVKEILYKEAVDKYVGEEVKIDVIGDYAWVEIGDEMQKYKLEISTEDWIEVDVKLKKVEEEKEELFSEERHDVEEQEEWQDVYNDLSHRFQF